jgi:DNA modification methylase
MFNQTICKMDYKQFIETKKKTHVYSGFDIADDLLNPHLFEFQRFIVKRALLAGKYAIFADCGLGKTIMQLEWSYQVARHTGKPVLIIAPLAVTDQTIEEGAKFGIHVGYYEQFDPKEHDPYNGDLNPGVYVTNYEQLGNVDADEFSGVVLDESSILKNFEGATKQLIIETFKNTPYKLACTATPSPNDPMELGNHAEFLDVMSRNEMLAMYFVHDGGDTSKWRIKGHAVDQFYRFVASWAVMLTSPSDIGFPMQGYDLPELRFIEKQIETEKRNNGQLFNDVAISATDFNGELRLTKMPRLSAAIDIVNNSKEQFIVWIKQNEEGEYLKKAILGSIEVKGSDAPEYKKKMLLGFAKNEFRVLITKTKIAQFGLNYQNCHNQVFASLDFSFEGLYQAIRRSYRFGQSQSVNIFIISTDTMTNVIESIKLKEKKFKIMQEQMANAINEHLAHGAMDAKEYDIESETNEWFSIKRGDCVPLMDGLEDESIGFSVFSPPFAELYTYSSHVEDMGNSKDYKEFLIQFGFLVKELYRVLKSGRNVAVHCMDLPIQKGKEGYIGLRDFSGMILSAFQDAGFVYHSRVTIWKDPVTEMQRTKSLGLLHKQIKKDSTMSRVGIPDYVLIFRKDGERVDPVRHYGTYEEVLNECIKNPHLDISTEKDKVLPVDLWQKYASPVWMDINYSDTLQGFRNAREEEDEKHICPLQLPTIERLIHLYTNPGDTVLTPFMGIGSEVYQAVKMGRKGIGFELKESYFQQAKLNCNAAIRAKQQLSIF